MTPFDFLTILLTAAALHRLWNYEAVGALPRAWAGKIPYLKKPLLCPACNAFWFSLGALLLWKFAHPLIGLAVMSTLIPRVVVWVYEQSPSWLLSKKPEASQ